MQRFHHALQRPTLFDMQVIVCSRWREAGAGWHRLDTKPHRRLPARSTRAPDVKIGVTSSPRSGLRISREPVTGLAVDRALSEREPDGWVDTV